MSAELLHELGQQSNFSVPKAPAMSSDSAKYQTLAPLIDRYNRDTSMEAKALRKRFPMLSDRQLWYRLVVYPLKVFWKSYVWERRWREGVDGLVCGALSAWAEFLKWAKYWALGLPPAADEGESLDTPHTIPENWEGSPKTFPVHRARVSVVILTKNEEKRIARCLNSVCWADEIIVVDGVSTDRTVEICRSFGATVISHPFDGSFATDRNLGMEAAHGEWVLQIDADDVVSPEFQAALFEKVLRASPSYVAFKFHRQSVLLGRVMRHGGWYYAVPNVVRRDSVRYEGSVHERPRIAGAVGELDGDIVHHPCENLHPFVARHNRYTSLQAEELLRTLGTKSSVQIMARLWKRPWKTFWKSYVKKGGYREGFHGLVFAEFFAGVELLKWAKCWERSAATSPQVTERCASMTVQACAIDSAEESGKQ